MVTITVQQRHTDPFWTLTLGCVEPLWPWAHGIAPHNHDVAVSFASRPYMLCSCPKKQMVSACSDLDIHALGPHMTSRRILGTHVYTRCTCLHTCLPIGPFTYVPTCVPYTRLHTHSKGHVYLHVYWYTVPTKGIFIPMSLLISTNICIPRNRWKVERGGDADAAISRKNLGVVVPVHVHTLIETSLYTGRLTRPLTLL